MVILWCVVFHPFWYSPLCLSFCPLMLPFCVLSACVLIEQFYVILLIFFWWGAERSPHIVLTKQFLYRYFSIFPGNAKDLTLEKWDSIHLRLGGCLNSLFASIWILCSFSPLEDIHIVLCSQYLLRSDSHVPLLLRLSMSSSGVFSTSCLTSCLDFQEQQSLLAGT